MRLLYVTPYVPTPIRTRPYAFLRRLACRGHKISLLCAHDRSDPLEVQAISELRDLGVRVEVFPVSGRRSVVNCLSALVTGEPLQARYAFHPAMASRLVELSAGMRFDLVHIEHLRAARLVRYANGLPRLYDAVDCISLLFEQAARKGGSWRSRLMTAVDLERTRRYEAEVVHRYDRVVVSSERDQEALRRLASSDGKDGDRLPIEVITNGVDLNYFRPPGEDLLRDRQTIVFTGKMSYHANVSAVLYFVRAILPVIWERFPEVRFQIVGKDPPAEVRRLGGDLRIEVTGFVPDLRAYLQGATVAVCPMTYAVGVQNKVLEAMACGTPVVCTSHALGSLKAVPGRDLLVADAPDRFAVQVMRVLGQPELARQLGASARRYVELHHSWDRSVDRLEGAYCRTIFAHRQRGGDGNGA